MKSKMKRSRNGKKTSVLRHFFGDNNILYRKVGRKYIPDQYYFNDMYLPKGYHLVVVSDDSRSCSVNIKPEYAELLAAVDSVRQEMIARMQEANQYQPELKLTKRQKQGYAKAEEILKEYGVDRVCWRGAPMWDIVEVGLNVLIQKAEENKYNNLFKKKG